MQALVTVLRKVRSKNPRVLAALECFGDPNDCDVLLTDRNDLTIPGVPHEPITETCS